MAFNDDYDYEMLDNRRSGGTGALSKAITSILGIVFGLLLLPTVGVGVLVYLIFLRQLRWRPKITAIPLGFIFIVMALFSKKQLQNISLLFVNSGWTYNKPAIIGGFIYLSIMLGLVFGYIIIIIKLSMLKRNPELRHVKGWAEGFKFAPTPLEKMRKKKNIESLSAGLEFDYEKAPLGVLDAPVKNGDLEDTVDHRNSNAAAIVYRHYTEAMEHTLITGKTGSGKTQTMLALIQNDILAGYPVAVIDFKKSPDFVYFLSKWAKENNRQFYHFVSGKPGTYRNPYKENQATYDPLSTGGATSKADMILNLRTWDASSEVFKKRTQDVLQSLFFLLERTPREAVPGIDWDSGGLAQFVSALDLNNFKAMIELMAKDMQAGRLNPGDVRRFNTLQELYKELSTPRQSDLKAQIVELLSIARTLIVSNYGDWLAKGASEDHIDLMEIATSDNAPIVLFSFNQQEEPEFAEYIGSIVMSDLSRVSALKNAMGNKNYFGVYIDEFQTLDPATVKDNLEKARSSRMFITLSLQSIDQIVSSAQHNGEAMASAIIDTTANFIFHDGSGYDTAQKMSKIIGEVDRYVYKSTSKMNNKLFNFNILGTQKAIISKDIQRDWLIPPSEFQSLSSPNKANNYKATAYVINKAPDDDRFVRRGGALARKVHIVVPEENAIGVPDSFREEIFINTSATDDFVTLQEKAIYEYTHQDVEEGGWIIEDIEVEEPGANTKEAEVRVNEENTKDESKLEVESKPSQLDMFKQLSKPQAVTKPNANKKESKLPELPKLPDLPDLD